eukprot:gene7217-7983_t
MKEIADEGIFVSDLETMNLLLSQGGGALRESEVGAIISIGCSLSLSCTAPCVQDNWISTVEVVSFPDVADDPCVCLLPLWTISNQVICAARSRGRKVVLHCVYGQSRSAATALAFLLMERGSSFSAAFEKVSTSRHGVCINPGLLAQLCFVERRADHAAAFRAMRHFYSPYIASPRVCRLDGSSIETSSLTIAQSTQSSAAAVLGGGRVLACKKCRAILCDETDLIEKSCDTSSFVDQHVNAYWRNVWQYDISRRYLKLEAVQPPARNGWIVCPQPWMKDQQVRAPPQSAGPGHDSQCVAYLSCECGQRVGSWRRDALLLCFPLPLLCDLFLLDPAKVRRY